MRKFLFRTFAVLASCFLAVVAAGLIIGVTEIAKIGVLAVCWSVFGMFVNSRLFFGGGQK